MSSLRARLLAAVLAITAVGLLALAAITYYEQRNFQYDRIDRPPARARARWPARSPSRASGEHDIPDRDGDHDGGPPRGGGPGVGLPAGTYGELRTNGVRHPILFDYGQNISASPKIPAEVEVGKPKTISGTRQGRAALPRSSPPRSATATSPWWPSRSPRSTGRSTSSCSSRAS